MEIPKIFESLKCKEKPSEIPLFPNSKTINMKQTKTPPPRSIYKQQKKPKPLEVQVQLEKSLIKLLKIIKISRTI